MKKAREETIVTGSGNVYADLNVPGPEETQAKARLMHLIADEIERRGLTQAQAADIVGAEQSDISNITRGRGRRYSMDRLFAVLHRLGGNITIVAEVGPTKEQIPVFARPLTRRHGRIHS